MSEPEMGRVVVVKTDGKPGLDDAICAALWERAVWFADRAFGTPSEEQTAYSLSRYGKCVA